MGSACPSVYAAMSRTYASNDGRPWCRSPAGQFHASHEGAVMKTKLCSFIVASSATLTVGLALPFDADAEPIGKVSQPIIVGDLGSNEQEEEARAGYGGGRLQRHLAQAILGAHS